MLRAASNWGESGCIRVRFQDTFFAGGRFEAVKLEVWGAGLFSALNRRATRRLRLWWSAGARTLSSVVASQIATHLRYGGVVPELASREHLAGDRAGGSGGAG